jgi:putative FmdB family regulatory protein
MPIYEYQCKKCGEFEVTQRITEAPLKQCPTCRGRVTKLISSTSFQLKGSGWYVTDYGRKDSGGKASAAESKSPEPKTGESKDSDSKADSSAKPSTSSSKSSKEAAAA